MALKLPVDALCRICGMTRADSEDHSWPQSAGNRGTFDVLYGVENDAEAHTMGFVRRRFQNGFWTLTGCTSCNSKTARLGTAFKRVVKSVADASISSSDGRLLVHVPEIYPSRALAQMYAIFLSALPFPTPPIWRDLQEWLLDSNRPLPSKAPRVFLYANRSKFGRIAPFCLLVELRTGRSVCVSEFAMPGLGIVFADRDYDRLDQMQEITDWIRAGYFEKRTIVLTLPKHVLHTQHPLAFGTPRQYEALDADRGVGYFMFGDMESFSGLGALLYPGGQPPNLFPGA